MKNDFIQAKSLMTEQNWHKLMTMSEEEIESNAVNDADNPPFSLDGLSRSVVYPDGNAIYFVPVERKIDIWLKEHNLQADIVASTLLKQFVEAQDLIK